jgi:hypothetical protein
MDDTVIHKVPEPLPVLPVQAMDVIAVDVTEIVTHVLAL